MHAACSDAHEHEMVSHLAFTHLVMEPHLVGFRRHFPDDHAMLKLMAPHFRQTLAINSFGRITLLAPGSTFDNIVSAGLQGSMELMQVRHHASFVCFVFAILDTASPSASHQRAYQTSFKANKQGPRQELKARGFDLTVTPDSAADK